MTRRFGCRNRLYGREEIKISLVEWKIGFVNGKQSRNGRLGSHGTGERLKRSVKVETAYATVKSGRDITATRAPSWNIWLLWENQMKWVLCLFYSNRGFSLANRDFRLFINYASWVMFEHEHAAKAARANFPSRLWPSTPIPRQFCASESSVCCVLRRFSSSTPVWPFLVQAEKDTTKRFSVGEHVRSVFYLLLARRTRKIRFSVPSAFFALWECLLATVSWTLLT